MRGIRAKCLDCEGTGRNLNRFDPPVPYDSLARPSLIVDRTPRSPSGREILPEACRTCHGRLVLHVLL